MARKSWKLIFWFFGTVVVLVGIAVIYIQTADWNRYKSVITEIVERQSGLRLDILGDISLTLFPRPALSVARIQLSKARPENTSSAFAALNAGPQPFDGRAFGISDAKRSSKAAKPIISAGRLDIVIALGPLFRGEVSPRDLRLIELEAKLFIDQEGTITLYADTGSADVTAGTSPFFANREEISGRDTVTGLAPDTPLASEAQEQNVSALFSKPSNDLALKKFDGLETLSILNSRIVVHQKTTEALVTKREARIVEITMQGNIIAGKSNILAKMDVDGVAVELDLALERNPKTNTKTVTGTGIINKGIVDFSGRLGRESFASRIEISARDGLGFLNGLVSLAGQKKVFSPMTGLPLGVDISIAGQNGDYDVAARLLKLGTSQGSFTGKMQRLQAKSDDPPVRGKEDIAQSLRNISQPVFTLGGDLAISVLKIEELQDILVFKKENPVKSSPVRVDRETFDQKSSYSNITNLFPLLGDIHFSIGAVPIKQGALQQISGRIVISDQAIDFKDISGLMPGATSFNLSGRQLLKSGAALTGAVSVTSGSLRNALAWLDVDASQMGSLDRLSTAMIKADFSLDRGYLWQLHDISALIDSSKVRGDMQGRFDSIWPSYVDLEVDFVPVQAWFGPNGSPDQTGCFLPDCFWPANMTDFDWSVDIDTIPLGSLKIKNAKLNLSGSAKMIDMTNTMFSLADDKGSLATVKVAGAISRLAKGDWSSDLEININDIKADPITMLAFGDYRDQSEKGDTPSALGIKFQQQPFKNVKTGQIQIKGPVQTFNIIANFSGADQSLQLTSQAGLERDKFRLISAQGAFSHPNINPLLRRAGANGTRRVKTKATFSLTSQNGIRLLTSGNIGGGRFIATFEAPVSLDNTLLERFSREKIFLPPMSVELSLNAPQALEFENDLGISSGFLVPDQPFSLAANLKLSTQKESEKNTIDLTSLILTQPGKRIEGNLILSNHRLPSAAASTLPSEKAGPVIEGEMTLEGFKYPLQGSSASSVVDLDRSFAVADKYSGDIKLKILGAGAYGQSFSMPESRLSFTQGHYQFASGKTALLNDRPVSISLSLAPLTSKVIEQQNNNIAKALQMQVKSDGFDPASFLKSFGYKTPLTSQLEVDLALSAILEDSQKVINTVSGAGTVKISGGALTFLNASSVSSLIEQGDNLSVILARLPVLLKSGRSSVAQGDIAFRAEEGIILLDRFEAKGLWGGLSLDGQINLRDQRLRLSGDLALSRPFDIPIVPVRYEGALSNPSVSLDTDKLLSFAQTLLTGRVRKRLGQDAKQNSKLPARIILDKALEILIQKDKIPSNISSSDKPIGRP